MMYTLNHPRIAGVFVEVKSAAERDAHIKAGWVLDESPAGTPAAPDEPGPVAEPTVTDDPLSGEERALPKRSRKK